MNSHVQHFSADEFYDLVSRVHSWRPVDSGFEVIIPGTMGADNLTYFLSEVEINRHYPLLFPALVRLVALNKKMRLVERVEGKAVLATLNEWQQPLHIRTIDGEEQAVLTIEKIKCSPKNKQVLLTVQRYDVHHTEEEGLPIVIAGNPYRDFPIVSAQDMDVLFPGWFVRYKVASELGYEGSALANAVCIKTLAFDTTGLEGVSF